MPPKKKSNKRKGSKKGSRKPSVSSPKPEEKKDVEMKDAKEEEKKVEEEKVEEKEEEKVDPKKATRDELKAAVMLILQAVTTTEFRSFTRINRYLHSIRKKQTVGILVQFMAKYHPELQATLSEFDAQLATERAEDAALEAELTSIADKKAAVAAKAAARKRAADLEGKTAKEAEKMLKDQADKKAKEAEHKKKKEEEEAKREAAAATLPETKAFVHLLTTMFLIDQGKTEAAAHSAKALVDFVQPLNRRSMDHLSGKMYYLFTITHEKLGQLDVIRSPLLHYHRTAALQHNEPGQASLVVCILRSFLAFKLYHQADKFRLNTTLPESRGNDVYARYLYYIGQINAVQLQYSDAFHHLTQAARKAPQKAALGFRQTVNKLLVIVQLLMGEVPERSIFISGDMQKSLKPYFELTRAVRVGDLGAFETVVNTYKAAWQRDDVSSLIARLRNNVIKTGLRKINLSYSRISLQDIASKLNLDSADDAMFIVSKCIHDGVIDAVIDRENNFMFSKEHKDRYATQEPQAVLHKRVMFCMDIHNSAVKAMRYPHNETKPVEDDSELREDDELEADSMDDD